MRNKANIYSETQWMMMMTTMSEYNSQSEIVTISNIKRFHIH